MARSAAIQGRRRARRAAIAGILSVGEQAKPLPRASGRRRGPTGVDGWAQLSMGTSAAPDAAAANRPVPATANRRRRRAGTDAASQATSAVETSP